MINLMGCRLINLTYAIAGYLSTNTFLIGRNGSEFFPLFAYVDPRYPTEGIDDIGIYVAIPFIVKLFRCNLEIAVGIFFYGLALLSLTLGLIGIFFLYKDMLQRFMGFFGLICLIFFACIIGDVYTLYIFPVVAIVPLCMYSLKKECNNVLSSGVFFISGLLLTFFHFGRAYAGLGVLVFIFTSVSLANLPWKKKVLLCISLCMGAVLIYSYFYHVIQARDLYVKQIIKSSCDAPQAHPFWHTIYLGFSFLRYGNHDHIKWDDTFGLETAKKVNPTVEYHDEQYEVILRHKVFELIRDNVAFVIMTLIGKCSILVFYLFMYGNIGLIVGLLTSSWFSVLPFCAGLVASALSPLLSLPFELYSLEFIALVYIFALCAIMDFIVKENKKRSAAMLFSFGFVSSYMFGIIGLVKRTLLLFISYF